MRCCGKLRLVVVLLQERAGTYLPSGRELCRMHVTSPRCCDVLLWKGGLLMEGAAGVVSRPRPVWTVSPYG